MKTILSLLMTVMVAPAYGSCMLDSHFQEVSVTSGGKEIKKWMMGKDTQSFTINNTKLVIVVEPASAEVNKKYSGKGKVANTNLLSIQLFDERELPRKLLSRTYGPPNSEHGYSAAGPANGVRQLGDTKLVVHLSNASCK
ncbi:hypothetical protein [Undibacterium curvum]|uniref:hypothetical protein n=1 Tax=Undibacterium curvum TaxID=2762294 RepID=UPI003D11D630